MSSVMDRQQERDRILEALKNFDMKNFGINSEQEESEWNDTIFSTKYLVPNRYKERASQKCAISAARIFLNWYIGGSGTGTFESVAKAFLALASYASRGDVYVISNNCFSAEATESNCFTDLPAVTELTTVTVCYSTRIGVARKSRIKVNSKHHGTFTLNQKTTNDWYKKFWDILNTDPEQDKDKITKLNEVLNYLFFVSLNTFRLFQKPIESLEKHIPAFVTGSFVNLWSLSSDLFSDPTPPPITTAIGLFNGLGKGTKGGVTYLSWLVESYVSAQHKDCNVIRGILKSGCLLTFSETGLGLIHWLKEAAKAHSLTELQLLDYFSADMYHSAFDDVKEFLTNVMGTQNTWPWARLFSNGAYYRVSTRKHPELAIALATCVSNADENDPMWDYAQFKTFKNMASFPREISYGRAVYKCISEKQSSEASP